MNYRNGAENVDKDTMGLSDHVMCVINLKLVEYLTVNLFQGTGVSWVLNVEYWILRPTSRLESLAGAKTLGKFSGEKRFLKQ